MTLCPKCGYERQPKDDGFFPMGECPSCGIVYEKFTEKQRKVNEAPQLTCLDKPKKSKFLIWSSVVCLLIVFSMKIMSGTMHTLQSDTDGNTRIGATGHFSSPGATNSKAQKAASDYSSSEPLDQVAMSHVYEQSAYDSSRELSNTIGKINKKYEQLLSDIYIFRNHIHYYGWDTIKRSPNYGKIQSMLENYRRQHRYMGNDFFVCVDMAVNVWNMLATSGIQSKLMAGNVERDITHEDTIVKYLSAMNHAWVLAEVLPSVWIPLETTGGYIVEPSMPGFELYNMGTAFENPKDFKECNVSRKAMFETCNETVTMRNSFNQLYAGKPITAEGTEYVGRMKQRLGDCEQLLGKVTAYLQGR